MRPLIRSGAWLALLSLCCLLPAQHTCTACRGEGALPCRRCPVASEKNTAFCSEVADCSECHGALRRSCSKCADDSVREQIRARRAVVHRWLEGRRAVLQRAAGGRHRTLRGAMHCGDEDVELVFAPGKIAGGPTTNRHALMHLYFERVIAARARFMNDLSLSPTDFPLAAARTARTTAVGRGTQSVASPRLRIFVQCHERLHRRICPNVCGLVHQGVGGKRLGGDMVYALHHDVRDLRDDAALHRDLVHNVTHLLLSNVRPVGWIGERGLGWLDSGIAHYFEAAMCGGICTTLCHHEHSQPPLRFRSGKWIVAARQLLTEKRLPRLADILGANTADLTPEEHVLSFALVSHLIAIHGGREMGDLIRQAKRGVRLSAAMRATFGFNINELDDRLRSWLRGVPRRQSPRSPARARRSHVALYVYTREFVRPRHEQVVRMAIARRAAVHTSGFAIDRGKPVRRLGPVSGNVRHWRGDRNQSKVGSAWPFAAVLEFEKTKGQRGYLDWFRRARGSTDPGAWFLDPAGTYVSHINAETVCHEDQRFCYMAVVDTPTGGVIGSNEFAVRGRVIDAQGNTTRRGWWVRFFVHNKPAPDWAEELVPLVSWRVESLRKRIGIRSTTGLTMPARELAVWGTRTVFRFPGIPAGIRPCGPK